MAIPPGTPPAGSGEEKYPKHLPSDVKITHAGNSTKITATVTWKGQDYDIEWFTPQVIDGKAAETELQKRIDKFYMLHVRFMDDNKVAKAVWNPGENTITRFYDASTRRDANTSQLSDWSFEDKLDKTESKIKESDRKYQIVEHAYFNKNEQVTAARRTNDPQLPKLETELDKAKRKRDKVYDELQNRQKRLKRIKNAQATRKLYLKREAENAPPAAQPAAAGPAPRPAAAPAGGIPPPPPHAPPAPPSPPVVPPTEARPPRPQYHQGPRQAHVPPSAPRPAPLAAAPTENSDESDEATEPVDVNATPAPRPAASPTPAPAAETPARTTFPLQGEEEAVPPPRRTGEEKRDDLFSPPPRLNPGEIFGPKP